MQGDPRLLEVLNQLLANELAAARQHMAHSEICDDLGYDKLHGTIAGHAKQEMLHAASLIARVIFLDGTPVVSKPNQVEVGESVKEIVHNTHQVKLAAVKAYKDGMRVAREFKDDVTRDLLTTILKDEENHVNWAEAQKGHIEQVGIEDYLANQVEMSE